MQRAVKGRCKGCGKAILMQGKYRYEVARYWGHKGEMHFCVENPFAKSIADDHADLFLACPYLKEQE